ncbi:MAG TPA: succinate--CoA ligase subunit alpha [Bordetella sp.]|jgi:succinyl-CoA synthetase alpha subunit|nr:succinate--CoA ligase subunit alpha [Bordetella sp.]
MNMHPLVGLDSATPVLVQGITGRAARVHTGMMRAYGTRIVAGTSAGKSTQQTDVDGVPVYADCAAAAKATGAVASIAMVPPLAVKDAVREALDAGIRLVVTVAEGVPVHDALQVKRMADAAGACWIGASTPGLCLPGRVKLGFLPDVSLRPGRLGVMSKSGTLSYEICYRLARRGIGQSAWIGVGGDLVKGTRFADLLPFFAQRDDTDAVLVVGEIGGTEEEELAQAMQWTGFRKPVYALMAGAQAREGVTMGHAGALVHGDSGTLASKQAALRDAGAIVHSSIEALVADIARSVSAG